MTSPRDPHQPYASSEHPPPANPAPPPPGVGTPPGAPPPPHCVRRNNGLAVAGLVVSPAGLMTMCGALLIGPAGAILAHAGLRQVKRRPDAHDGGAIALTGIIIGWASFAVWVLLVGLGISAIAWLVHANGAAG
ncbi:DUF4190 domain-containing protein [Salinifilum ghardaiensis]